MAAALLALLLILPAAAPPPNGIPSSARPVPYGYCISAELLMELLRHHAIAFRVPRPTKVKDMGRVAPTWHTSPAAVIEFNRSLGIELPNDPEAQLPRDVDLWIPPQEVVAGSCCVWILSGWDGWVTARSVSPYANEIGFLEPQHSHAASSSGSLGVRLFPVPIAQQREWMALAGESLPSQEVLTQRAGPELRAMLQRLNFPQWDERHTFSFGQWVSETSKVARITVSLPIADVDGEVRFAEPPTAHYLDARGKETPHWIPTGDSQLHLVLLAVAGAALLGYLLAAARRRRPTTQP
ncbi:MAG: hypothetical protein KDC48_01435 [Planctomycetes bacterium]|nr:hypothetical protein [Planctomycetota bacterium]